MKTYILILSCLLALTNLTQAQTEQIPHLAQAPYLVVKTNNALTSRMPLKSTAVEVDIIGSIAEVKITQFYVNESRLSLDPEYIFKGSDHTMVHELNITTSNRLVNTVVSDKPDGLSNPSLLETPLNTLKANIQQVLPGEQLKIELRYTEALAFQEHGKVMGQPVVSNQFQLPNATQSFEGIYYFMYPRVIGTQYRSPLATERNMPFNYPNESSSFSVQLNIQSEIPIQSISSPTHNIRTQTLRQDSRLVLYSELLNLSNGRNFELQCVLGGEQIEAGAAFYAATNSVPTTLNSNENFFSLLVQPPLIADNHIAPPREYIFFVDVSPTMHGAPLEVTKDLIGDLVGQLRPQDLFNVFLFDYSNKMLSLNSLPADYNKQNLSRALHLIDTERSGHNTKLLVALNHALSVPPAPQYTRNFIIVSDGQFHIDQNSLDVVRNNLDKANFFTMGIGEASQLHTLHDLAQVSLRKPFVISDLTQSLGVRQNFVQYISHPILSHVQLLTQGVELYDLELVPQQNSLGSIQLPDLFRGEPLVISGKYRGNPQPGSIRLQGRLGNQPFYKNVNITYTNNEGVRYLWGRKRVEHLEAYRRLLGLTDVNDFARKQEIQRLGISYELLTSLTTLKDNVRGGLVNPRGISVLTGNFVSHQARPYLRSQPRPNFNDIKNIKNFDSNPRPVILPDSDLKKRFFTESIDLNISNEIQSNPKTNLSGEKIYKVHRVRARQKLEHIAQLYGVSTDDIKKWSGLASSVLFEGQMLTLQVDRTYLRKRFHEVKEGESLYKINRHCGATISEIKKWNNLSSDRLRIGQQLLIYELKK